MVKENAFLLKHVLLHADFFQIHTGLIFAYERIYILTILYKTLRMPLVFAIESIFGLEQISAPRHLHLVQNMHILAIIHSLDINSVIPTSDDNIIITSDERDFTDSILCQNLAIIL